MSRFRAWARQDSGGEEVAGGEPASGRRHGRGGAKEAKAPRAMPQAGTGRGNLARRIHRQRDRDTDCRSVVCASPLRVHAAHLGNSHMGRPRRADVAGQSEELRQRRAWQAHDFRGTNPTSNHMSVTIKHSRAFWFGPLPKRAKKLRKEWSYIEDGRGFLKAACKKRIYRYIKETI